MGSLLFAAAVVLIIVFSLMGAVVAGAIVAQNWRIIVYVAVALTAMALLSAAWHAFN